MYLHCFLMGTADWSGNFEVTFPQQLGLVMHVQAVSVNLRMIEVASFFFQLCSTCQDQQFKMAKLNETVKTDISSQYVILLQ